MNLITLTGSNPMPQKYKIDFYKLKVGQEVVAIHSGNLGVITCINTILGENVKDLGIDFEYIADIFGGDIESYVSAIQIDLNNEGLGSIDAKNFKKCFIVLNQTDIGSLLYE